MNEPRRHSISNSNTLLPQDGRWCTFSLVGLVQHREPTIHEWLESARHLEDADKAIRWCWGDLILLGATKAEWGEMYAQALAETPYSYHTLTQYVRVCRAFPIERRRSDVDWTHYQKLASLPESKQERILDAIEDGEIRTTEQTAERVRQERNNSYDPSLAPDPIPPEQIYPPCPVCKEPLQIQRSRCAACEATINEMAYMYRDLEADYSALLEIVLQFTRDGALEPLQTFVSTYNSPQANA